MTLTSCFFGVIVIKQPLFDLLIKVSKQAQRYLKAENQVAKIIKSRKGKAIKM